MSSTPSARSLHPRATRRRYAVRRVAALVALVALGAAGSRLASAVSSAGDTASAGASGAVDAGGAATEAVGDTSTTQAPVATGVPADTTLPVPPTPNVPTASDPAVVLIAGDSEAGTFGPYLEGLLRDTGVVRTELNYKVSSGLARPDFFNWPAHLRTIIPSVDPDIVVLTFGGNDAQGLTDSSGTFVYDQPTGDADKDARWRAEYGTRVGEVIEYLASEGRTLVWVGIPNDDNPEVTARMQAQDEVVREQVAANPEVIFIDTWKRFSGISGNWAEYVIDPRDNQGKDVRADDGFHLNVAGAEILALDIAEVIRAELVARGASV